MRHATLTVVMPGQREARTSLDVPGIHVFTINH
jgi:hypothetical protein